MPEPFAGWFASRGWRPHVHQLQLLDLARERRDTLLIAPTGGGKTLAGFLPSLVDLNGQGRQPQAGIHTLYVSPLKALAVDIARNLTQPVAEMGLPITLETRTGDTPPSRRQRQRLSPPDILLTTPEQIALMLSHRDAGALFGSLRMVIVDELHAMASTKRGDLLALDLARLRTLSSDLRAIGLSATVARPSELAAFLVGHDGQARTVLAEIVQAGEGPKAHIAILDSEAELPWAGHSARYALPEIYEAIKAHRMSLIFVNTRSQAEMLFHALWRYNDDNLPIALHHGSLDVGQRRKVEAAMWRGACAPWCAPRRSTSASTGATSISSSMSTRRKGQAGLPSASAARIIGSTSQARLCSCRRTASRWLNARLRLRRQRRAHRTRPRRGQARSTCWRSTCSARPAPRRSTPTGCIARW
jgi:ATP-dependent Lhr-like helicase